MKNTLCIFIIFMIAPTLSNAQEDSKYEEMTQRYLVHLENEGYRPTTETDGDVKFKQEGMSYYITPETENTFTIAIYLALDDDQQCSEELMQLINDFNAGRIIECAIMTESCKTVGLYSASHLARADDWVKIFEKSVLWLDYASDDFFEQYKEWQKDK